MLAISAALFVLPATAQTTTPGRATVLALKAGDTTVNTGTSTRVFPVLTAGYEGVVIQDVITKQSGTGAGTVQLQSSLDGTNWVNLGSAYTITNVATQSAIFYVNNPVPVYLQLLVTGSGTESILNTYKYVYRKHD